MKKTLIALGMALVGTAAIAGGHGDKSSKDHNMYVLGSVGVTDFRNLTPASLGATSVDDSNTSASIGLGWKFHKHLAVELSYSDLGKYKYDDGVTFDSLKATSTDLSLVGNYPINHKWDLTGKLGVASTKVKDANGSDKHTTAVYGLGVDYKLDHKWTVGANWDRYHNFADTGFKLDAVSVKVKYNF